MIMLVFCELQQSFSRTFRNTRRCNSSWCQRNS